MNLQESIRRILSEESNYTNTNVNIGDIYEESDIYQYIQKLHYKRDYDFWEGDLSERIEKFPYYEVKEIPIKDIEMDEYQLDEDDMEEYIEMFKKRGSYPPIVLGKKSYGYYNIIDGTHRANALRELGFDKIICFVGKKENMNIQENIRRILMEDIDIKHMTSLLRRHEYVLNLIMKRCSIFQMTYDICEESSEDFVDVIITDTLLTIKGKVFIGMEKNQSELSFGLMKEFLTKKYGELIIEYYNRYCNYQELDEYARTLKNARQQGVGLRFPKSAIKSNPSRFRPYNRKGVNESDLETNQNDKRIVCEKCGWSWDLSDGGDDPYTCHKCGNENHKSELTEKCWKGYTQKGMKTMFGKRYPNCVKIKK